jgi:anti-sigma-K factor RskA
MTEHTEIEELFALEALGGLEPDDRELLAGLRVEHGFDCADCAALQAGFGETAVLLAAVLAPSAVSADLEERTLAAALAEPRVGIPPVHSDRTHRWRTALVAVAAAVVLVVVGATAGYLAAPSGNEQALEAFLDRSGVTFVPLEPTRGQQGSMTMAIAGDGTEAYVLGSGLPALPGGQVYAFWTISGETPTSTGCAAAEDGRIRQLISGDFSDAELAAVTVEDATCPAAPTTPPILVGQLA